MDSERSRSPVVVVASSAAGIALTALSWRASIGLSWLVIVVLFVAGVCWVQRKTPPTPLGIAWGAAAIWLAWCLTWRASLWTLTIAYPASLTMAVTFPLVVHRRLGWRELGDLPALTVAWLLGVVPALHEARRLVQPGDDRTSRRVLGGLLLGLPISATIAVLLSANPRFRDAVAQILTRGEDLWSFVAWSLAGAAALLVGGLALRHLHCGTFEALRNPALLGHVIEVRPETSEDSPYRSTAAGRGSCDRYPRTLSPLTWAFVLAQLVVVFGLFVAVNLGDLFGGHRLVRAEGTTTYAEYLHAGFAEVTVAALCSVGVVMFGHCVVVRAPDRRHQTMSAGLELLLLALTAITLASCWQRTTIYMDAYGYTHLRLGVVLVQIGVLGLLVSSAVRSVVRSWATQMSAVVALPIVMAIGAASINADLVVARANLRRLVDAPDTATSTGLDERYLLELSIDALPALDADHVPEDLAERVRMVWLERARVLAEGDWRSRRGLGAHRDLAAVRSR